MPGNEKNIWKRTIVIPTFQKYKGKIAHTDEYFIIL